MAKDHVEGGRELGRWNFLQREKYRTQFRLMVPVHLYKDSENFPHPVFISTFRPNDFPLANFRFTP